jgi:hypothetical protein
LTRKYPGNTAKIGKNRLIREVVQYALIFFRNKDVFKRVALGTLVMFFQQWPGIDSSSCLTEITSQHTSTF